MTLFAIGRSCSEERNLNVRLSFYVISKTMTLGIFALVQCILFVLIGNYVLQIRGMFWIDLGIVFMTAMAGVSLGLLVSSVVSDPIKRRRTLIKMKTTLTRVTPR